MRWIDLRRDQMQRNIRIRAQLVRIIREEMEKEGYGQHLEPFVKAGLYKRTVKTAEKEAVAGEKK